jgi:hypothetical protein
MLKIAAFLVAFITVIYGNPDTNDIELAQPGQDSLFVSLGSTCEVAYILREAGLRNTAFPFDWMVTIDGDKLIELIDSDFALFLDHQYLEVGMLSPGFLMQTYYRMEFLHEGDFRGDNYPSQYEKLYAKCQRRIERFRQLKNYPGKVFFVRSAYKYSLTNSSRIYFSKENIELTDEYAQRLHDSLRHFFPHLSFDVIILNNHEGDGLVEEKKISDHIFHIRLNWEAPISEKALAFQKYIPSIQ